MLSTLDLEIPCSFHILTYNHTYEYVINKFNASTDNYNILVFLFINQFSYILFDLTLRKCSEQYNHHYLLPQIIIHIIYSNILNSY